MEGIVETLINEFFEGTDYLRPAFLSLALAIFTTFILKVLKGFPKRYKALIIMSVIALSALLFDIFAWKIKWLHYVTGIAAIIPLLLGAFIYLVNQHKLKQIIVRSNEQSRKFKEDAALRQLKAISPAALTPKQRIHYNRYSYMCL